MSDLDALGDGPPLNDAEQTLADTDQTLSDADQTGADSDQTSADIDQLAADKDQVASDRDLASGGDAHEHDVSEVIRKDTSRKREQTAHRRDQTADARLDAAAERDRVAELRDHAASARDHAAEARDLTMAEHEAAEAQFADERRANAADAVVQAAGQRKRGAQDRFRAAQHRAIAADDRQRAARDRAQAADERLRARHDREALAHRLAIAETDQLTGARARAAGLTELDHELDRCGRTGGSLIVVYVDVCGLKALNDTEGHAAGDRLLMRIVALIREQLRSYDLVVRLGGDEFLCAMSNVTLQDARQRFDTIASTLEAAPGPGAIRTGFAQLGSDESAGDLIARADGQLVERRLADGADAPQSRDGAPARKRR